MSYRILDAGDAALTIEFGSVIDPALLAAVNALDTAVLQLQQDGGLPGVIETMPTFRSLTVFFISHIPDQLQRLAKSILYVDRGQLHYQGPLGDYFQLRGGLNNE